MLDVRLYRLSVVIVTIVIGRNLTISIVFVHCFHRSVGDITRCVSGGGRYQTGILSRVEK